MMRFFNVVAFAFVFLGGDLWSSDPGTHLVDEDLIEEHLSLLKTPNSAAPIQLIKNQDGLVGPRDDIQIGRKNIAALLGSGNGSSILEMPQKKSDAAAGDLLKPPGMERIDPQSPGAKGRENIAALLALSEDPESEVLIWV